MPTAVCKARMNVWMAGVLALGCALTTPAHADWFDDFNDGSVTDGSPVDWVTLPVFPGTYDASSGDYVFTALDPRVAFENLASAVPFEFSNGASIRTQTFVSSGPPSICGVVFGPLVSSANGYAGFYDDGFSELAITRCDNGFCEYIGFVPMDLDGFTDFLIQMDVFDGVVSLTAWLPGEPKPRPQLVVADDWFNSGVAGILFADGLETADSGGTASGTFRFVHASSTVITDQCVGDLDGGGAVDGSDLAVLLGAFGSASAAADLDGNGTVDAADLAILLGGWGPCGS